MSGDQRCMTVGMIRGDEHEEMSGGDYWPDAKRMRQMPSSISIIRGAVAAEKIQRIGLDLEPFFRKAVQEELERSLSKHGHLLYRAPPLLRDTADSSPSLKLAFARPLLLPIFTNNKLVDVENNPLQVRLVDITAGYYHHHNMGSTTASSSHHHHHHHHHDVGSPTIKLEVLVLDGDFKHGGSSEEEGWTSEEFSAAIVRERQGRRPLLVGTLNVTMAAAAADHSCGVAVIDDVSFTDNSSWIRSRRFRIGVRAAAAASAPGVVVGGPRRIREAVSESFVVKDHRGELYKKHFPPESTDEVWRLKNIGKDGPIHRRLESEHVRNVQDFLNLHATNTEKLKTLVGMSDRLWKATLNHAKTCNVGAGQVMQVKQCSTEAYQNWDDQLEESETNKTASFAGNGLMASGNLDQAHDDGSLIAPRLHSPSLLQDEMSVSSGPEDSLAAAALWSPFMGSCDDHDLIIYSSGTAAVQCGTNWTS